MSDQSYLQTAQQFVQDINFNLGLWEHRRLFFLHLQLIDPRESATASRLSPSAKREPYWALMVAGTRLWSFDGNIETVAGILQWIVEALDHLPPFEGDNTAQHNLQRWIVANAKQLDVSLPLIASTISKPSYHAAKALWRILGVQRILTELTQITSFNDGGTILEELRRQ